MKAPTSVKEATPIELNMTSMIDVVFLLLIFFVCTSDFKEPEKQLPTNLATAGAIQAEHVPQQERDLGQILVRLFVAPNGRINFSVDGKRLPDLNAVEATLDALREIDPNVPVIIAPEKNVPLEPVLDVYDASRRVGLAKIKFAASQDALARR